jgi:hypothetical protein
MGLAERYYLAGGILPIRARGGNPHKNIGILCRLVFSSNLGKSMSERADCPD